MLEGIRKKTKSVYILLIFGAIIIVFVFWGGGTGGDKSAGGSIVAIVNNEAILFKDYMDIYKRQTEYYKDTMKEQFTEEMAKSLNLRGAAINIVINRTLAAQDAESKGVKASDKEIQKYISGMPNFQVDGRFNQEQYFKILGANRIEPGIFERSIGFDMVAAKMRERVTEGITVTDSEVRTVYFRENRRIELSYLTIDAASFEGSIEVGPDEAREYLGQNSSQFVVPLKLQVSYAHVAFKDFQAKARVGEDEVSAYYESNPMQFEKPAELRASHILIRPDSKIADKAEAEAAAESKAADVLKRIKNGEKFATLALKFSEDPGSASAGGELGWFARGVMLRSFEEAAFSMAPGEVSPVVKTEFGYHIIKVIKRREAGLVPLKKVRAEILARLKADKGRATAEALIAGLQGPFIASTSVEELAAAVAELPGVKLTTTPEFHDDDRSVMLLTNHIFKDIIFTMGQGDVTRPVEVDGVFYLIKIVKRIEPHVPEYSLISAEVLKRVKGDKSKALASAKADELLEKIKGGGEFSAIGKAEGLRLRSTGLFSMAEGVIPNIGMYVGDNPPIFTLTSAAPHYMEVVAVGPKFYLLKLKSAVEAAKSGFGGAEGALRSRLQTEKEERAIDDWIDGVREKADIEVFEELL